MTRPALAAPNYPRLFAPVTLGTLRLPNRIVVAPMTRVSATDGGQATARMARYYADYARGGFGLIIAEGTYPDHDASQGYDKGS